MHFEGKGGVQATLQNITHRLNELGIQYVVVGGMALFRHGFRRFTEDVDLLVTREGLKKIHEALEGLGYVHVFKGSKKLRDTSTGVTIDFLISGEFPGDGKPKPVAFPDPSVVAVDIDGLRVLQLERLIELKLASGMSSANRAKDINDVMELIKRINLPRTFVEKLDPYVRDKFIEQWDIAQMPDSMES